MIRSLTLVAMLGLSSCGALNSLGGSVGSAGSSGSIGSLGFGRSSQTTTRPRAPLTPTGRAVADSRGPVARVDAVAITPSSTGALLTVQATPLGTGAYNLALVPVRREGRTLIVELRGQIAANGPASPAQVAVARPMSRGDLAGVNRITVVGAGGSRTISF